MMFKGFGGAFEMDEEGKTQTMNDQTACTESENGGNVKRRGSPWKTQEKMDQFCMRTTPTAYTQ